MKVVFIGYMAAGKSLWAKRLAAKLGVDFIDLDTYLEDNYLNEKIFDFIEKKGELAFRKLEKLALLDLLAKKNDMILATGGGAPCYFNNIDAINKTAISIFLNVSIKTLVNRLTLERENRPILKHIPDDKLQEFIAKHLFERNVFYRKANFILDEDDINLQNIENVLKN